LALRYDSCGFAGNAFLAIYGSLPPEEELRVDLERGAIFDASAMDYDQYRPSYPNVVVREVVSLSNLRSSSRLLEIGCGTGKATVPFAARGFTIDCVDPGKKLIAFAERNCRWWQSVVFMTGRFEEVHLEPYAYDLIYSAQAFHWVDPTVRLQKVSRLLREDGCLALMYNYPGKQKDNVLKFITDDIKEESDGKLTAWDYMEEVADWEREIRSSGLFKKTKIMRHRWTQQYNSEKYAGLFRTYSDFLSLPKRIQKKVLGCMRRIIKSNGGYIHRSYDCVLIHSRKR
jgi:SAM-dependent methyltransferase